jgi:signal transduction histidine kinase
VDTGIGFSAEEEQRIFEPFGSGSEAVTREFGGLGLGLASAKPSWTPTVALFAP